MDLHCTSVIHSHWCHVCTCNCMLHSYSMHTTNDSITVCVDCAVLLAEIWAMVADFVQW